MHLAFEIISYALLFVALYFEILLLITYFESRNRKTIRQDILDGAWPGVSIIVPCWNEEKTLSKTVESLLNLDYPKDRLAILVVDDGSTDGTYEVAKRFENKEGVKIYHKENGGKHSALNFAIEKVETEFVGCLDADSFIEKDALKRIMEKFRDQSLMAVTPSIKVHKPKNILELIQKVEYGWGVLFRSLISNLGAIFVTPGPFSIFRVETFRKIGGYKEAHKTEDMEMALRMQSHGLKIGNAPEAFVYTSAPKTFRALYKQRLRWTYGFMRNALDYKRIFFNPQYGNLGMVVLPVAGITLFSNLFFAASAISNWISRIVDKAIEVRVIGFSWSMPSFEWFYVNTGALFFVSMFGLLGSIFLLLISRKMAEGKIRIGLDIFLFMVIYAFITPLWISRALYNVVFAKDTKWR